MGRRMSTFPCSKDVVDEYSDASWRVVRMKSLASAEGRIEERVFRDSEEVGVKGEPLRRVEVL